MRERGKAKQIELADPIQEILSIPQMAFCEPSAYLDRKAPGDCARLSSVAVIGPRGQHRLLVIDDPSRLAEAFAHGVADAACSFEPVDTSTAEGKKRWEAVCEITEQFKPKAAQ